MRRVDLPTVQRVNDEAGSHIEPALDPDWDEPTKLAWHAAAVAHDTGLTIRLHDEAWELNGKPMPGYYGIGVGRSSCSSFTYRDAWSYLNGVSVGAENVRDQPRKPT